jgi:hypothetical protein
LECAGRRRPKALFKGTSQRIGRAARRLAGAQPCKLHGDVLKSARILGAAKILTGVAGN